MKTKTKVIILVVCVFGVLLLIRGPEAFEMAKQGAIDQMENRLKLVGLGLENVVQMDCLFRDIWNIPVMEKVIKERFNGKYPVRKSIQTNFAHNGGENGLQFQLDGVAYAGE